MPPRSPITPEIAEKIRQLASENHTVAIIAKKLSVEIGHINKTTLNRWCKKNNIDLVTRMHAGNFEKHEGFAQDVKNGMGLKEAYAKWELKQGSINKIIKKYNLDHYTKIIHKTSHDRVLSIENAQLRVPEGEGAVVEFCQLKKKFKIQTSDDFIYYKSAAALVQGDPRGKGGSFVHIEDITKRLKDIGYTYLNGYIETRKSFTAKHDKCGYIRTTALYTFATNDCPRCANTGTSKPENNILEWVKSLGFEAHKFNFPKERIGKRSKEIDVYIPSKNFGIEYCGLYWHSDKKSTDKRRHLKKLHKANGLNISLITIFEDEWKGHSNQVKSYIKTKLGLNTRKIFARNTTIKLVNRHVSAEFLNKYHIQEATSISVAFGLYLQDELVGLVTGARHHRNKDQFTLNRLAFKDDCTVVGGASKLMKALFIHTKSIGYDHILSWSDLRWSDGQVYKATGWKQVEKASDPDYSYVLPNGTRESKQINTKKKLLKKGGIG